MDGAYELVVVGAGLTALSFLAAGGAPPSTVVVEYEERPGGFLRPALPSAAFPDATSLLESPFPANVELRTSATAVGLLPATRPGAPHTVLVRSREGTDRVLASRVLIASGGLELTRENAQIPGSRPAGVMTPIMVHQLLDRGFLPGHRVVLFGDSRYATITGARLRGAGVAVVSIAPPAQLLAVQGEPRVEHVLIERERSQESIGADALIYAAGKIANTHWLVGSGVDLAADGRVQVDQRLRTNLDRVYAAGTCVAPSLDHDQSIVMGRQLATILREERG